MENYDNDVLGTGNPEHPANRMEGVNLPEPKDLIDAFTQYEILKTKKSLDNLREFMAYYTHAFEQFNKAKDKFAQWQAVEQLTTDLYAKVDFSKENEAQKETAVNTAYLLKKELFEILK